MSKKPKILLCTPEITELPEGMGNAANFVSAKGGGLGDISASLVRHLNESREFELHIVLPKYDNRIKNVSKYTNQQIDRLSITLQGKGIHLVNDSAFSYLSNPYAEHKLHSPVRRSLVFQRYVINNLLDWIEPDVVHCNDWMTGLIPAAAKAKGIKSLFTLHNIFTEKQTLMDIELSGIKPMEFVENLYFEEFPENIKQNWRKYFNTNKVDFTASAIFAADYFNTVSQTFLEELKDDYFPELVSRPIYQVIKDKCEQDKAFGILNAPNDTINPEVMPDIINFNKHTVMEKKAENKKLFQEKMKLPLEPDIPLFFWPNRLYSQKSPELLVDHAEYFLKKYKMQIAVVANGDLKVENKLKVLSKKNSNLKFQTFDESLSTLGKAASDFILMPSRYEPCGLPQMEVPRFGTLPIVRATGGLKDTIEHLDVKKNKGNGFVFVMLDKTGIEFGIKEALKFYEQPFAIRMKQIRRIMSQSRRMFNMEKTAGEYMKIYEKML
ncbi:MAG TPA: glycogen synthase [Candidatus Cloacimonetes bacterium]|nr:glycogen synthase [Candidatus Cloacimonadota bacterium]